jgi:hypothetical protein
MIHVPIKRENLDAKAHTHEECNMKTGVMLLETNELPEAQQENRLKEKKKTGKLDHILLSILRGHVTMLTPSSQIYRPPTL